MAIVLLTGLLSPKEMKLQVREQMEERKRVIGWDCSPGKVWDGVDDRRRGDMQSLAALLASSAPISPTFQVHSCLFLCQLACGSQQVEYTTPLSHAHFAQRFSSQDALLPAYPLSSSKL